MPCRLITYKRPNFLGTLHAISAHATVRSREKRAPARSLAGRLAVAEEIRGARLRLVRVNNTAFLITPEEQIPAGYEHDCYAYVVAADAMDGTVILDPEEK